MQSQNATSTRDATSGSKHNTSTSRNSKHSAPQQNSKRSAASSNPLPSFAQWQARQLSSRDLMFAAFMLCMYLMYLRKTVPAVCANAPMNSQQHGMGGHYRQLQWPVLWRIICGQPDDSSTSRNVVTAALRSFFQALTTFTSVGILSGDPLHIFIPPLRVSLLLLVLLPLPYISLSAIWHLMTQQQQQQTPSSSRNAQLIQWYRPDTYWRKPTVRNTMIVIQRLFPSAISAVCLGFNACGIGWYTLVQKTSLWRLIGKYAFQGWVAYLAVLPLRLHLIFNILEWGINYIFYSNTLDANGKLTGYLDLERLCVSFIFVVVIPTLGVLWLERGQKQRYRQFIDRQQQVEGFSEEGLAAAAAAAATDGAGAQGGKGAGSSSSSGSEEPTKKQQQQQEGKGDSQAQVGSSCSQNMESTAAATAAAEVAGNRFLDNGSTHAVQQQQQQQQVSSAPAGDSNHQLLSRLSTMRPALASLLGAAAAEAVAAAAAAASGVPAVGQMLLDYQSKTECVPFSIKVHAHNASVSALGPVLNSVLHYQLSPYNTAAAPLGIQAAAFAGCVQLIANVLGLSGGPAAARPDSGSSSRGLLGGTTPRSFATSLLAKVVDTIRLLPAAAVGPDNSSSSLAVRPDQPEVDVAVGGAVISTRDPTNAAAAAASSSTLGSTSVSSVSLHALDPVYLISGVDQQIRLQLKVSGLSGPQQGPQPDCQGQDQAVPTDVRLLIVGDGAVVIDQDITLSSATSVEIPAQAPGVLQLALLPGKRPAAAVPPAAAAAAVGTPSVLCRDDQPAEPAPAPAAAAAPLLLLPLLVLPEAAAADLGWYHQQLAAAAAASQDSGSSHTSLVWQSVSAVITDVAYILSVCAAARPAAAAAAAAAAGTGKSAAVGKQPLPASVRDVLKHLLIHLAACGMVQLLQFVVETAAAVFVGDHSNAAASNAAAAAAAPEGEASDLNPSSISSSSSGEFSAIADQAADQAKAAVGKPRTSGSDLDLDLAGSSGSSRSVCPVKLSRGLTDIALKAN